MVSSVFLFGVKKKTPGCLGGFQAVWFSGV